MEITPMMRQYHEAKAQFPDAILFFHLGDFYETFFEDAILVAQELEITLTQRDGHPMAGVPVRKADVYINRLLRKGYKVAICQQLGATVGEKLLRREVVRVLTPGTVVEEGGLEASEDAFLAAVWPEGDKVGVAWAEAASGEFWAAEVPLPEFANLAARISPREWLLPEAKTLALPDTGVKTTRPNADFSHCLLAERFPGALADAPLAARAAGAIVNYLRETVGEFIHLQAPKLHSAETTMALDPFTLRSLEILVPLRPEGKTLLSVLDRTKTAMGRRLLRRWLLSPLRDKKAIEARLDAVSALVDSKASQPIGEFLRRSSDISRLIGRIGIGHLSPLDLIALRRTLAVAPEILSQLRKLDPLPERLSLIADGLSRAPLALADEIGRAMADEPPPDPSMGGLIRDGYSSELDALRAEAHRMREAIAALEAEERRKTGIPTLRVGYTQVLGYFLEVTRSHLGKVPQEWRRRQSLSNCERFTTPELAELAERLRGAEAAGLALEEELFRSLCERARREIEALTRLAEALSELDVLRSLAEVAHKQGYTRPRFTDRPRLSIRDGRHPVVEQTVEFVPNDLSMDEGTYLAIVTGPNMAGKSVFLRQVALISLLAQIGSFVPAKEAELPVLDRIYTRVGASDAIAGGLSTFMAEMKEAAIILAGATKNSLVILDELGRGTSTHDGMALAWSIARSLAEQIRCKTLFATHYRELAQLSEKIPGVINLHMMVREWRGEVIFLHRVRPGVAERSYGVQVAKLAHLPEEVLAEAERILTEFERTVPWVHGGKQLSLFDQKEEGAELLPSSVSSEPKRGDHPVLAELRRINPEHLTPIEALELIFRLKELLG